MFSYEAFLPSDNNDPSAYVDMMVAEDVVVCVECVLFFRIGFNGTLSLGEAFTCCCGGEELDECQWLDVLLICAWWKRFHCCCGGAEELVKVVDDNVVVVL